MPVQFGSAVATVTSDWTTMKATLASKGLLSLIQYTNDGPVYTVFAFDVPLAYVCTIWQGAVPDGVVNSGYSQAQNDTDKTDFETNYKPVANTRIHRTDQFGNNLNIPFNYAAAIPNFFPGLRSGTINGYLPTASTGTLAVRATAYQAGTANAQRSIKSSSALDVNTTGTGAWQVKITYLDAAMTGPYTEVVNLNGTTAVNTVGTNICFIERMEVVKVGSGGSNVGTISLQSTTAGGGSTMGSIAASDNSTFWAHHYIPVGVNCYLLGLRAGATVTPGSSNVQTTGSPLVANLPFSNVSGSIRHGASNSPISDYEWDVPLCIVGPNFIIANERADSSTASTAFVSFDYVQY